MSTILRVCRCVRDSASVSTILRVHVSVYPRFYDCVHKCVWASTMIRRVHNSTSVSTILRVIWGVHESTSMWYVHNSTSVSGVHDSTSVSGVHDSMSVSGPPQIYECVGASTIPRVCRGIHESTSMSRRQRFHECVRAFTIPQVSPQFYECGHDSMSMSGHPRFPASPAFRASTNLRVCWGIHDSEWVRDSTSMSARPLFYKCVGVSAILPVCRASTC